MNLFKDLTIIVAFYKTPQLLLPFLKSFVFNHLEVSKFNILVAENSPDSKTEELLKQYQIPYLRNPGMTHNPAVDLLFDNVKTKYALLCDSDILIMKPLYDLFDLFVKNDLVSMGEIQYDRGGYKFKCPRVAPYWNLLNLDKIKEKNIKFYDPDRVKNSGSEGFFKNVPLQQNLGGTYYDTGTSFYEDLTKNNLKIGKINQKIVDYVFHAEGCSWRKFSNINQYVQWGNEVEKKYLNDSKKFENVDIKGKFE